MASFRYFAGAYHRCGAKQKLEIAVADRHTDIGLVQAPKFIGTGYDKQHKRYGTNISLLNPDKRALSETEQSHLTIGKLQIKTPGVLASFVSASEVSPVMRVRLCYGKWRQYVILLHMDHEATMKLALEEAELAVKDGNAPFACVVTDQQGNVVLREHDRVKENTDPTAHGEVNAIRALCKKLNTLSLHDYTFYTTSEPCPTCMTCMIKARVPVVYYGAKTEATASLPIPAEEIASKSKKYPVVVTGGILAEECLAQRNRLLS